MKIKILTIEGTGNENIEISDNIFSSKISKFIVSSVVEWQRSKKEKTGNTKQRNEIIGSTSKIYAQKGTGGARHSSRKAPLFVGGGRAHGPKGNISRKKKINKKVRKLGLINILSEKNKNKKLIVMDDVKNKIKKTKIFYDFLSKNKIKNVLLIPDENSRKNIELSARNIPNLKILSQIGTNVFDLVKYENVLFTKTSIKNLENNLNKWAK